MKSKYPLTILIYFPSNITDEILQSDKKLFEEYKKALLKLEKEYEKYYNKDTKKKLISKNDN